MTSTGVPIILCTGPATAVPNTIRKTPLSSATTAEVLTALRIFSLSFCPIWLEMTALAPIDMPTNRLISRLITGALLPTAASASLLANRPTTATSTELNSCCSTLLAANGSANKRIFMNSGP